MALLTKSIETAHHAVTKAEATVREWEGKAAGARTEAAELDANSGALILDDPAQAEKISVKIQTLERTARVCEGTAEEARRKLNRAQRNTLEVEAAEEDKLAKDARKRLDTHVSKVENLLAQLHDLDGCDYAPARSTTGIGAHQFIPQIPRSVELRNDVVKHEGKAAVIRFYLATGNVARDYHEVNEVVGTTINGLRSFNSDGVVPACVYAAREAGIVPESVGA